MNFSYWSPANPIQIVLTTISSQFKYNIFFKNLTKFSSTYILFTRAWKIHTKFNIFFNILHRNIDANIISEHTDKYNITPFYLFICSHTHYARLTYICSFTFSDIPLANLFFICFCRPTLVSVESPPLPRCFVGVCVCVFKICSSAMLLSL